MSTFKDKTVLITGGASGIGKIMGRLALERGARLIIWDINSAAMQNVKNEFTNLGKVETFTVDISQPKQIEEAAQSVKEQIGTVDMIINNAGIVVGSQFEQHSAADIERTMAINSHAPMHITRRFLPEMLKQNSGHICNIASSAGLVSNPKMSVYVASKWALVGWSDSLRIELQQKKSAVGVTTVTPYYINTGMFDGVKSVIPILKPEKVAKQIIKAIEKGKIYKSMPWSVRFVRFGQAIMPIWFFDWFIGGVFGVYKTMDHFTGRKTHSKE